MCVYKCGIVTVENDAIKKTIQSANMTTFNQRIYRIIDTVTITSIVITITTTATTTTTTTTSTAAAAVAGATATSTITRQSTTFTASFRVQVCVI